MVAKKAVKKTSKIKVAKSHLSVKKAFSKSEIASFISEANGISKKQTIAVLDSLMNVIEAHLSKKGPGIFVLPGVAKFRVVRKSATKARKGNNPFTGEPMIFAAKPARNIVKVRALKKIKDAAK
jgi:nucleoid DNA-binding protein